MTATAAELADRIQRIDWAGDFRHTASRVRLMLEYLRRAALWAQRVDRVAQWPFFDIAEAIDPAARADAELVARTVETLPRHASLTCTYALHFAELATRSPAAVSDLPDPFEPLILMYERGGDFVIHHAHIEVDLAILPNRPLADYADAEPFTTLDAPSLDALDEH